jgi:hypothetical protein
MSFRVGEAWIANSFLVGGEGFGVLGSEIPSTGDNGAGYTYNDLSLPADANKEICGRITTWPTDGTLYAYEDTSFTFSDAPDGAYFFEYQLYVDGIAVGSPTRVDLVVGDVTVTGTISWTESSDTYSAIADVETFTTGGASEGYNQGKRRYRIGNRVVEVTPAELKKVIEQEILAQEKKAEKKLKPAQITKTVEKTLAPLVELPLPDVLPVVKELKQRLLAVKETQSLSVLKAVQKVEQQLIAIQEEDDEDEYILSLLLMD